VLFGRISSGGTRISDAWGRGQFGSSRIGHMHQGLDVKAAPGEVIRSPITGTVTREAKPYAGDSRFKGVVVKGTGDWAGTEVKLFYVQGWLQGRVEKGQPLGNAQDLSLRYPDITNHVHIEVRQSGLLVDPATMFGMCF
jgi:hypothetical protein